ncbi:hypothetical protein SAMN02745216_04159 [Desulfatibacillum alkenivorans DSM 16219]|jgi:hypothetical protein|uniref:Uncharacterized protein n=1 Tax=Desulfatibacillum alkenivorans DSM 16219 TaxID=1121393 RepID=A0A1M6VQE1_9BACT|nr:hypothetical protein [Desulfatibacillum alkenivorans]SHK83551.1 hypothetical protein SAMN02745216_04159 [Desulfatibacillum alkenivorans DSM 16219]
MQSDKILAGLKELAEKIGIKVTEQVLKSPGIHVRSGLCTVRGEERFILDKKLNQGDKIEVLADCLCLMDTNGVFLVPQIRDLLAKHRKRAEHSQKQEDAETVHAVEEDHRIEALIEALDLDNSDSGEAEENQASQEETSELASEVETPDDSDPNLESGGQA